MKTLINKAAVRQYLLDTAASTRTWKFNRVAGHVYDHLEGLVRREAARVVQGQPSLSHTIALHGRKKKDAEET